MPGPQSVHHAKTPTAIQPSTVEAPPSHQAPPPSAGQIRDDASSAIHQMQGSTAVRGARGLGMPQAVATLVRSYEEGGIHAVNGALRENPALVAALGGRSREQVENALGDHLGFFEKSSVMGAIQSEVTATLRRAVVDGARDRLGQHLGRIGEQRGAIAGELEKLGSPPSDPVRAAELEEGLAVLDEVRDNLSELQTRFQGQAWEVGDFEQLARRASLRMGMGAGTHDSFVLEALEGRSGEAEGHTHHASMAGELAVELPHVLHGSVLAAGTLTAGLLLGTVIHHAAEEHRAEFIDGAHALGIR